VHLCELHIIQNIERKASKNIVGRAKSDRKARAGSVLNLLFLFIGGFMSNKEKRMNRNKSIIEDYKNGKPILEIAREYNLSETMCYKILKGTQEPPRYFEKKRKRLTTRNEQIVKQYKGGMTARELGKMYGISMQRIYAILHSSGEYESQKYNHIETALKKEKKIRNQTFLDAYKKNPRKSIIELSREVNISPSLGYLILHQNGIYQYNVKARAKENSENAD
jgi:Mor family transcriptional regulator